MTRYVIAALLAFSAASATAQPADIQPTVDTPEQRQSLSTLTSCLIQQRPRWARQTLAQPYLSQSQARIASYVLSGRDTCVTRPEVEVTFRTSSLVASLAEHYVRNEIGEVELARLSNALNSITPLNVSEDFALCVVSRNPVAARTLTLSTFGSADEAAAAQQLASGVAPCTSQGENLTVDLQALRALSATALYRAVSSLRTATN
jgi:hypothetical protein